MDKKNCYRLGGLALSLALSLGCVATVAEGPATPSPSPSPSTSTPAKGPIVFKRSIQLKPNYPQRYTVALDDTLWDIASRFLKSPWRWPEVWQKNPQIDNPHLIYPGDILLLHFIDGAPYIKVERPITQVQAAAKAARPTVKLVPKIGETEIASAITTIPTDAIAPFLNKPYVITEQAYEAAPYVLSSKDGHLIAGVDNTLYIRNLGTSPNLRYTIVRKGTPYIDPADEDEILGFEATYIAEGEINRMGDPASFIVQYARREILNGDRLIVTAGRQPDHHYLPHAPAQSIDGRIISIVGGVSIVGQHQIVVLNLGREDKVEEGEVLAVYRSGMIVHDSKTSDEVELPAEQSGIVMIFRVFDRVSYALVMESTNPMHLYDQVTNP